MDVRALRQRWKTKEPFKSAADAYAKRFNLVCERDITELLEMCPITEDGYHDLRGFDFCLAAGFSATFVHPELRDIDARKVDFSGAQFVSVHIRKGHFEDCKFCNALFQAGRHQYNTFLKCNFSGSQQYDANMGWNSVFDGCSFSGMRSKGLGFEFGARTQYRWCKFANIDLKNLDCQYGMMFSNCIFSGHLSHASFLAGPVKSSAGPVFDFLDFISRLRDPVPKTSFTNCDLTQLVMSKVLFQPSVLMQNTLVSPGWIKQPDGSLFYPEIKEQL